MTSYSGAFALSLSAQNKMKIQGWNAMGGALWKSSSNT